MKKKNKSAKVAAIFILLIIASLLSISVFSQGSNYISYSSGNCAPEDPVKLRICAEQAEKGLYAPFCHTIKGACPEEVKPPVENPQEECIPDEKGACAAKQDESEDKIYSAALTLSKQAIEYSPNDVVTVTIKLLGKDNKPLVSKQVYIRAELDKSISTIPYIIKNGYTDKNGVAKSTFSFDTPFTETIKGSPKIKLYLEEFPKANALLAVTMPTIKILSAKQLGDSPVWQDSWGNFEVEVQDTNSRNKQYTLESDYKSAFRAEGKESETGITTFITKENKIQFGWKSPKISQEMRMKYTKRMIEAGLKAVLIVAESEIKDELVNSRLKGVEKDSTKLDEAIKAWHTASKIPTQVVTTPGAAKNLKDAYNTDDYYERTKNLVSSFSQIEGTVGLVVEGSHMTTALEVGLSLLQDWYQTVDDMAVIANAGIKSVPFSIVVQVEDLSTKSKDAKIINVNVEGYDQILVSG